MTRDWLPCPEAGELIDIRLPFRECRREHSCGGRPANFCPLYVERLVKQAAQH
jgi:hypothetical protein